LWVRLYVWCTYGKMGVHQDTASAPRIPAIEAHPCHSSARTCQPAKQQQCSQAPYQGPAPVTAKHRARNQHDKQQQCHEAPNQEPAPLQLRTVSAGPPPGPPPASHGTRVTARETRVISNNKDKFSERHAGSCRWPQGTGYTLPKTDEIKATEDAGAYQNACHFE
jgi:hypothetical protein